MLGADLWLGGSRDLAQVNRLNRLQRAQKKKEKEERERSEAERLRVANARMTLG